MIEEQRWYRLSVPALFFYFQKDFFSLSQKWGKTSYL